MQPMRWLDVASKLSSLRSKVILPSGLVPWHGFDHFTILVGDISFYFISLIRIYTFVLNLDLCLQSE